MALILPNTIANLIPADGAKVQQNFAAIQSWGNQEAISRDGSTAMTAPLLLPGVPTQPNQAATKGYVDQSVPVGVMWEFLGDIAPTNWMLAQGQAISRATYAALFAVLGTKFGVGDGSTTFNLPAMQGRAPVGYYPGGPWAATLGSAGGQADTSLPAHQHGGVDHLHGVSLQSGGASARHDHQLPSIQVIQSTAAPTFWTKVGGAPAGFDIASTLFDLSALGTGVDRQDHSHGVNGATGAADRSLTTQAAGGSATNTNLTPYITLNFIVRVQ